MEKGQDCAQTLCGVHDGYCVVYDQNVAESSYVVGGISTRVGRGHEVASAGHVQGVADSSLGYEQKVEESIYVVGGINSIVGHGQAIQQEVASAGHGQGVAGRSVVMAENSNVVRGYGQCVARSSLEHDQAQTCTDIELMP